MANEFARAGANPEKQTKFSPLFNCRFSTGIWTNRSPFRDATTTRDQEEYYGSNKDSLIAGLNTEISNKLTLVRRPGNTVFDSGNTYSNVDRFYDFRLFSTTTEQINVMIDQANALYSLYAGTKSLVWTKSTGAGQSYMQSVGNGLYFGNGVDNKKWLQSLTTWTANRQWNGPTTPFLSTFLIDPNGNIQQLTGTVIQVTSVQVANDILTIGASLTNMNSVITDGDTVTFPPGMTASFLDGQTVTVTAVGPNSFGAYFINSDYGPTPEGGSPAMVYPGDGTPISGSTQPVWSLTVPSASNNLQGGLTYDGTVVWTNRGNPVENWGIQPPTTVLKPVVGKSLAAWAASTYYSLVGAVIDSNGNLQQVTKAGTSGSAAPPWSTVLGGTTYDNGTSGVTWNLIASASMMNWAAGTYYPTGSFVIGDASGTNCLFQSVQPTVPYISGSISAFLYPHAHSGDVGDFDLNYPTNLGSAVASASGLTGFNFAISGTGTGGSFVWNTINSSGQTVGTTNPFPGQDVSDLNIIVEGTLQVPVAGQHVFSVTHGDGLMWGIGGGATLVSGTSPDNIWSANTAANGYPVFQAGRNVNVTLNAGNAWVDTYTVNFPTPGTYPVEFNMARWDKPNAQMVVACDGNVLASGQSSGGSTSGSTEPTWPIWSTSFSPSYPSVTESAGRLQWDNIGPIADFTWHASTKFTLPNSTIVDPNNNTEAPYRSGVTGSSIPTFNATIGSLTNDNPNLIWINEGPNTAPPAGTVTTANGGWIYCVAIVNTLDNTVSNASQVSAPTGNFVDAFGVTLPPGDGLPPVSQIDPQGDYIAVFRSTDGGAQPFLIPGDNDYTNAPVTLPMSEYLTNGYTDTTPDTGLNNLIEAPILGENTPPGAGAQNLTYYLNRIFYSIGNVVYWTAGPDTPVGNGVNGTPPLNYSSFPSLVRRIVPITGGAVVFTVSDVYLIQGQATTSSPLQSIPFLEGIGLLSYNALDINGSIIGFFSTDNQFIILDPNNGVSSAGFPQGDQFRLNNGQPGQSWNPNNVYVTWYVNGEDQAWYVSDGQYGWFRLMSTPAPETGYTWSPFAQIVTGCKAVQSIETTPGVHNLLLGPTGTGQILTRNLNEWQDNSNPYPAWAVIGSAVLAQPGQTALVSFITVESVRTGTPVVLGVIIDEALPYYKGPFDYLKKWENDPPNLKPSTSISSQRFYLSEMKEQAAACRHMQIQINWAVENFPSELLSMTIYGGFEQEL